MTDFSADRKKNDLGVLKVNLDTGNLLQINNQHEAFM